MSQTNLTFIIPDLIEPLAVLKQIPAQELPELAIFSLFLSRGKITFPEQYDHTDNNFYSCLFKQFSLPDISLSDTSLPNTSLSDTSLSDTSLPNKKLDNSSQLPIASSSLLFDIMNSDNAYSKKALQNKWIMRLDPCFMMPDRDQLVLVKASDMDLSLTESKQLIEEIKKFYEPFKEELFWSIESFSVPHSLTEHSLTEHWYLISDKAIHIDNAPPEKVVGQAVKSYLFRKNKEDNRYWLTLFNELQMILHQSSVNKTRQANKKIPINSLWFWGESEFTPLPGTQIDKINVYSNNSLAQALSSIQGCNYSMLPNKYVSACEHHSLYTIEDFSSALQNKDIFSWLGLLEQFEENYLRPALHDINSGKLAKLEIISPTGKKLLVTKKLLARWWQRKRKFSNFFIETE